MDKALIRYELQSARAFLLHTVSVFDEADAGKTPAPGAMTIAAQIAHTALTVDWFIEGATRPEGFSMDFEDHYAAVASVDTLAKAKAEVDRAWAAAEAWLETLDDAALAAPLPDGPVLPGVPVASVLWGIVDHTAHHRGMLAAYARVLGKVAPMPYEAQLPWGGR